jgi:SecD/SecF fusion protein
MHLVLKVDLSQLSEDAKKDATERALSVIRNRIDQFGVREPLIQRQGEDMIIVQLPGITERQRALDLIGKTALLEFKMVSDDPNLIKEALEGNVPKGYEIKYLDDETPLLLEANPAMTGEYLTNASVAFDQNRFNEPYVTFTLNSKGARKFAKLTKENIQKRLAIVLDGKIQSAPVIQTEIPAGEGRITGRFSIDDANDLAIVLRAGALPAPIQIEEERTGGPTLGRDSIAKGVKSIIIGGITVVVFMAVYYLWAGIIANFALSLNLIIILGALAYFQATLTLPGIAGILLTIGMAVDANVLIFERIREEIYLDKPIRLAISSGYKKAFLAIFDSNLTTLITAFILFQFGTGPVRGFATTLSVGIIASMFTALVVTRLILDLLTLNKYLTKLPMLRLVGKTNIDFVGMRKKAFFLSAVVIIAGMVCLAIRGEKSFGIDFTGGTIQQFRFAQPVAPETVRGILREMGQGNVPIQQFGDNREIIVRTYTDIKDQVIDKFKESFLPDNEFEILRLEKVGPTVGKELTQKTLYALFFSLLGICAYVSFRFEFKSAVAALVALFHDVLVTIGAVALTGREFSLPIIAALLTIVGYSINDTIVVFNRIRENLKLMRKSNYITVLNTSINQTLSRTLLTSLTTLFAVLALFIFGGEVINDFAFVLLVGILVGTYSSVFVASPILASWRRRR